MLVIFNPGRKEITCSVHKSFKALKVLFVNRLEYKLIIISITTIIIVQLVNGYLSFKFRNSNPIFFKSSTLHCTKTQFAGLIALYQSILIK